MIVWCHMEAETFFRLEALVFFNSIKNALRNKERRSGLALWSQTQTTEPESLKKRAEKHREMQFTRHEMPINIKIENDLLLWEIEVISVWRSISHEWWRRRKGSGLIIARKSDIHYDLYRCHVEAARTEKRRETTTQNSLKLLYLDFKRENVLLLHKNIAHNEWDAFSLRLLKRTQNYST